MSLVKLPQNPVELASIRAEQAVSTDFEITSYDDQVIAELEYIADELGFINERYFIEAQRGICIPYDLSQDEDMSEYSSYQGITFEGRFITFSKVHIGRIIGAGAVRAVCMTFDSAMLLPYFDSVGDDELLHIPVLSVESISATSL